MGLSNEMVKEIMIQISLKPMGHFLLTVGNKTQIPADPIKHHEFFCIQLLLTLNATSCLFPCLGDTPTWNLLIFTLTSVRVDMMDGEFLRATGTAWRA